MYYGIAPIIWVLIILLVVWDLIIRGIGLWKAANNKHTAWFIALMVLNTVGILPLIYVLFFSKPKRSQDKKKK
ncbi:MAG: DUF5652 family protein [Candidatus Nanoarchaeia archaeon]|nr:DUF5652 family protein [Candidatus Nanoarchaeia archaeon]